MNIEYKTEIIKGVTTKSNGGILVFGREKHKNIFQKYNKFKILSLDVICFWKVET